MPILTKEVEVIPMGKAIPHYKNKGYDVVHRQPLKVKIEDLPIGSDTKIEVLCDMCEENTMMVKYNDYNRVVRNTGNYVCKKCAYIKQRQNNFKKYGVQFSFQLESVKEKSKQTMLSKYGVEHHSQLELIKEKVRQTNLERYGTEYYSKTSEWINRVKQTNTSKYGFDNPNKSPEIREKLAKTYYRNSSQKSSKQQRYICDLYKGILNFPIKYYNADICLPSENIIVEYDGGGHMLNVIIGQETIEEYKQKEIIRYNVVKREGYKQIHILSSIDLLPFDDILLQMLEEARQYFVQYPNHFWIEYNIDDSIVRNAEHKNGIFFDYGVLRKIN